MLLRLAFGVGVVRSLGSICCEGEDDVSTSTKRSSNSGGGHQVTTNGRSHGWLEENIPYTTTTDYNKYGRRTGGTKTVNGKS